MNKKYKVDSDGNLVVVTDLGEEIEREDKYTESTNQILSLENVIEPLEKKIDYFEGEVKTLEKKCGDGIKNIISFSIVSFLVVSFLVLIYSLLSIAVLIIFISIFSLSFTSTFISEILELIINKKKMAEYNRKINIEKHKIEKLNKKIEMLSKNKEVIKQETDNRIRIDKIDNYIDVKSIFNYYDVEDYFIMNYLIDKNTKKENPSKKKVRKLTKEDNQIYKM